jgi:hypothetical protein
MTRAEQLTRREEWRKRVAEYRASGLSGSAWCAAHGIKPHLLYYWLRRFRLEDETESTSRATQWLPVVVSDGEQCRPAGRLLVHIGDVAIEVHPGYDTDTLVGLIRVLKAVC